MASEIATTPDLLMLAVQAQLVSFLTFPSERVVIDAREDDDDTLIVEAEQYVIIRVEGGTIDKNSQVNRGRLGIIEHLQFSTTLWTRLLLDESPRDDQLVADPNRGHLIKRHALYDALIDFGVEDSDGNLLSAPVTVPQRSSRPRKSHKKKGWARSWLEWVMPYELALTAVDTKNL